MTQWTSSTLFATVKPDVIVEITIIHHETLTTCFLRSFK